MTSPDEDVGALAFNKGRNDLRGMVIRQYIFKLIENVVYYDLLRPDGSIEHGTWGGFLNIGSYERPASL